MPHKLKPNKRIFRTQEVARAVGVHANTVRLYETWGFIAPIKRDRQGYRAFRQQDMDQMRLARLALHFPYPGGKQPVLELVHAAKQGAWQKALELAGIYLRQIKIETKRAQQAVRSVEVWLKEKSRNEKPKPSSRTISIRAAAQQVGASMDQVRNWERNGLIAVPRQPENGYRAFGLPELRRLQIIRVLRAGGYSTMAILRMLRHLDQQGQGKPGKLLDTPRPDEDFLYVTDHWLTTLAQQKKRAKKIICFLSELKTIYRA